MRDLRSLRMLCSLEGRGIKLKKTLPLESLDSKDYSRNPDILSFSLLCIFFRLEQNRTMAMSKRCFHRFNSLLKLPHSFRTHLSPMFTMLELF